MKKLRGARWFDAVYRTGVAIKGLDGAIELLAGVVLLVAPQLVHQLLQVLAGDAYRHTGEVWQFVATYIARLDGEFTHSAALFLIVFLVLHGTVKLALAYCLLRRIVWAYPYALGLLGLFLVYQAYVLVLHPLSIGMWLFTLLDVVIVWLVWGEWKDLREARS